MKTLLYLPVMNVMGRELLRLTGEWAVIRTCLARKTEFLEVSLVINEIHYDPGDESTPGEFIELFNPGDGVVDLSGWRMGDGVEFTFPPGTTIAAGGYVVVAEDPATWEVVATGPLSEESLGGGVERALLRGNQPDRGGERFLRIRVSLRN